MIYHSALKGFKEYKGEYREVRTDKLISFRFDVETDPIPQEFREADFIYLEPPYQRGYEIFNERAVVKGKGYNYLMQRILDIVKELDKPFYLIGQKKLPVFQDYQIGVLNLTVHNADAYLYSNDKDIKVNSNHELLDILFQRHNVGLDFTCGYGNTGLFAKKYNKKVILTDVNHDCIGYIYENLQ